MSDRGSLSDADTRVTALPNEELRARGADRPLARLGPYLLLRRLGLGGMAEVFLAREEREGAPLVVVKRMLPQLAEQGRYVEMFRREARVALRLEHPNIVRAHGLVEERGQIGLVMEYLEGLTLYDLAVRSWDAGRSLPLEPLVRMIADAARALHFAHHLPSEGGGGTSTIVHRDVSPDNLLVTKQGATKLLDFGVAKPDDDTSLTRTGQVKGKVSFMSPEQARGEKLDGRSDLFSLGTCCYWLVTGVRPFDRASPVATMEAVTIADIPRPRELNDQLPAALELVILRLLERDRRERTSTGREVAEDLDGLLGRVPRDFMSPARLIENVLDVEPNLTRPWPTHLAVPSVDWASGERRALADPSAPLPTTGDWAALETRQLPVFGLSELLEDDVAPDDPHSGVFASASLGSLDPAARSEPRPFVDESAPTLLSAPLAPDTIRMPQVADAMLPADDPATVPLAVGRSSFPSDLETDPEGAAPAHEPGAVTQPLAAGAHAFPAPPFATHTDPDTLPELGPPPLETPPARPSAPQRAISLPVIAAPERPARPSSHTPIVVGAALLSVLTSGALAWAFLVRTEPTPPSPQPAVSSLEEERALALPTPPEAASPSANDDDGEPFPAENEAVAAPPPSPPEPRSKARGDAHVERAQQRPKKAERMIELRGPPHVTWRVGKRSLGRGARSAEVPSDAPSVRGYDSRRGVAASVPVKDGVADWDALGSEELVIRVRPWAKVWLGSEALGMTPLKPIPVVPGRYQLRLDWEGTVRERTVTVPKGAGPVIVNVDMRAAE